MIDICTLFMLPRVQSSLEKLRNCLKFSIHVKYIQEYTLLNGLEIVQQAQLLYLYASASLETKHKQRQRECGQQRRTNYCSANWMTKHVLRDLDI
jgi:ABC-type amino acid transport system permease subunit